MNDEEPYDKPGTLDILVDGDLVKSLKASKNQKPINVSIPVRGGQSVRLNFTRGVVAEPKFTKGRTASQPPGTGGSPPPPSSGQPAPFAVDPRDLDALALQLRQACDKDAAVKKRMETARIAIATFMRIDIDSESVAKNVAEDLYTAKQNEGRFQLVERGQLDKALQELKIQGTALIDPDTAVKIIGKVKGADVALIGSISDRGAFLVINAWFVDLKTGVQNIAAQQVKMSKIPINRD